MHCQMHALTRHKIVIKGLDIFITLELMKSSCTPGFLLHTKPTLWLVSQVIIDAFCLFSWGCVLAAVLARRVLQLLMPRDISLVSFNCKTEHCVIATTSNFTKELHHSQTFWDLRCVMRELSATQPSAQRTLRLKPNLTTSAGNPLPPLKHFNIL